MAKEDIREHPDYEAGYNAAWHDRPPAGKSLAYAAGYEAAHAARSAFEALGFTRGPHGVYSKSDTIRGGS